MLADVVVIGAGPAGCAAAIGLARAGARVVLYHRKAILGCRPGEIIEPTFRIALAELGLDEAFAAVNSLTLAGNVSLWDSETPVEADGMTNPYGLGVLIDRACFEEWLMSAARQSGVTVLQVDRRLDAETIDDRWRLAGDGNAAPGVVTTPLVIQATGRGKGLIGPRKRELADRLVALLMYGDAPPGPRDQRLLIEAGEHGWWYAAPLPDNRAVISFMTDADLLPPTPERRTDHFHAQLHTTRLIAPFAAYMQATSPIIGFPANSGIRQVIHGKGWVSIGDAAATYDPLSGRGVPVALAKGAAIARLVSNEGNASRALEAYADAERAAFADFRMSQRNTYRRAATRFNSAFWQRRCA
jgi:flavin-dependent dehydrogenase